MLRSISTFSLFLLLVAYIGVPLLLGVYVGRRLRGDHAERKEPLGVVQGALLGMVGLLLAFGLDMAVNRYEQRRATVVAESNTIGTTYLRAQMLAEPMRSESLALLRNYGDASLDLARHAPGDAEYAAADTEKQSLQSELWSLAGEAVAADPDGTAPRLYVETLNDMIDAHTDRLASMDNRVPETVVVLMIAGSAITLGVLALYLTMLGRGLLSTVLAGVVVVLILFVSFDLDRPRRGFITVPQTPLEQVRASMEPPPAVP